MNDVTNFTAAGLSDPQAQAIPTALDDVREKSTVPALKRAVYGVGVAVTSIIIVTAGFVVTSLRSEIAATRNELKTEVASARSELKADVLGLRNEIKTEVTGLRGEMVSRFEATNARVDATRTEVKADVAVLRSRSTRSSTRSSASRPRPRCGPERRREGCPWWPFSPSRSVR